MTTLVYGEDDHQDVQSTTEEERAEVTKNIRAWYEEGVRFFTKDRLRSIHEQLQGLNGKAGKILIPDLNGGHTEKPVDLGRAIPIKDEDCVRVLTKPSIRYTNIHSFWHSQSYQNINIHCFVGPRRDKETKELLDPLQIRSQDETEVYFGAAIDAWEATTQCKQFRELLKSKPHLTVNKVVAFANASIASKATGCHGEDRASNAAYQHALMLTLIDHFNVSRNSFAQDPAYADTDQQTLLQYGVEVVDDPVGFLQADDNTAVISISPDIAVKQVLCDLARPAILIWYKVEGSGSERTTDPDSSRVYQNIEKEYDCDEFPRGLDEYFASRLVIYTKKDK